MDLIFLSAIVSILSLDITIAFQMLISSPIFACPIIGWILGDVRTGFELGFLFQLIWLGRIPAGAYIVPEGNIASMISTALILLHKEIGFPNTILTIVFVEAIIISFIGAKLTLIYRKLNGKILNLTERLVRRIHFKFLLVLEVSSMFIFFFMVFITSYLIFQGNQYFLKWMVPAVGHLFENQFIVIKPAILGIGLTSIFPIFLKVMHRNERKKIG
jgi:mannose/fructose/N-acetylgalactosamine-specific phosphotransferase system component IIC